MEKKGGRIVAIKTLSGSVYRGKVFIDSTYEGDLMAAAGVSYHVGREANAVYGETLNGNEPGQAKFHQLHKGIDPYVKPGGPKSGLLPCVEPYDPDFKPGDGDKRVRRYVTAEGCVQNEGDVEVGSDGKGRRFPPYPIDYGAIVPKRAECANLFVPVCLSASHIAFGSIRMEPVFFALGQAAGPAASIAVEKGIAVQDVPYDALSGRLRADGQVL